MSLYVHIAINDTTIRTFEAQNITGVQQELNTYRICKYVDDGTGKKKRVYLRGNVYHNRKEGAIVLAKKVLDFAITMGEV